MLMYVHSAGRAHLPLPTLAALLGTSRRRSVRLVVQAREAKAYEAAHPKVPLIVLPPKIKTLSPTRQWILENAKANRFVLFDDDLAFAVRRTDDPTKFRHPEGDDLDTMLAMLDTKLGENIHVGVLAREGGNRHPPGWVYTTRMMRVLGYDRAKVLKVGARFDRLPTKQDFDMTLQLLRAGFPNAVLSDFVQNQAGSNTAGGCSAYRTEDMMVSSAHGLAKLHPDFVKVVKKETKTSWGGGERTDVNIQWKKALESANA